MTGLTRRDVELIDVALDSAADACQSGAALTARRRGKLDPLAREYLDAGKNLAAHLDLRADLAALITLIRSQADAVLAPYDEWLEGDDSSGPEQEEAEAVHAAMTDIVTQLDELLGRYT